MDAASGARRNRRLSMVRRVEGEATILAVAGNVDMAGAPVLASHLADVLRGRPPVVIVDLTEVNFLTTAGMSILAEAHRRSQESSMRFRIVAEGPITLRPMQLLGIDGMIEMHPTVADALTADR